MPPSEKARQTIIDKYGSWEEYKAWRYSPDKMKHIPVASKKGSEASAKSPNHHSPFKDPEVARKAALIGVEKRKAKK